jgi:outer membrane protein assembly factor BamB
MNQRKTEMIAVGIALWFAVSGLSPEVHAQTANALVGAENRSESLRFQGGSAAMPRSDLGRTGVFQTQPLIQLGGVKWVSPELFTMVRKRQSTQFADGWVWDYTWPTRFQYSPPIMSGNTLFFQVFLGDGYLMAVDAATGAIKWRAKRVDGFFTAPVVVGDTLFVGTNNTLLALDTKTQTDKWRYNLDAPTSASTVALVSDNVVYFGGSDNTFYAVDAETGKLKWKFKTQAKGRLTSPVLAAGKLVFGDAASLYAINVETGREQWKVVTKKNAGSLSVSDGIVYFLDNDFAINAVRAETGEQLPQSRKGEKGYTALAVQNKTIYFGGKQWDVYAVDDETRRTKWKFSTQAKCREPVIAGNILYASCSDGHLYALEALTGKLIWKHEAKKKIISAPLVADANMYYVCDDGHLYALD